MRFVMGVVAGLLLAGWVQQPGKPGAQVPMQLPLAEQNEILKVQLDESQLKASFDNCQQVQANAQTRFTEDQTKIATAITKGLKELGVDPETHEVNQGTFYITEKPPKPDNQATPKAADQPDAAKKP